MDAFCCIDDLRLDYFRSAQGQKKLRVAEKDDVEHYCEAIEADKGTKIDKPGKHIQADRTEGKPSLLFLLLFLLLSLLFLL